LKPLTGCIIPPPPTPYTEYRYILSKRIPYNDTIDYWGKSIDFLRFVLHKLIVTEYGSLSSIDRIGIWLSGGFDSSLLLALTIQLLGPDRVVGYHCIWSPDKDESKYAKRIAEWTGTKIKILRPKPEEIFALFKESTYLMRAPSWCPQVLWLAKECAKDGCNKVFIGLGLDALTAGESSQSGVSSQSEFDVATANLMMRQLDYLWANMYQCEGYINLQAPFLYDSQFVEYMKSLPYTHQTKKRMTRIRLRDEVVELGILPKESAEYGKVAGTKLGFGPNWDTYFKMMGKNFLCKFHPENYVNLDKRTFGWLKSWRRKSFWTKLLVIGLCNFYELIDEGKFSA